MTSLQHCFLCCQCPSKQILGVGVGVFERCCYPRGSSEGPLSPMAPYSGKVFTQRGFPLQRGLHHTHPRDRPTENAVAGCSFNLPLPKSASR